MNVLDAPHAPSSSWRTARLWLEFIGIYIAAPAVLWIHISNADRPGPYFWGGILSLTVAGVVLLALTPGATWRSLMRFKEIDWRWLGVFALVTAVFVFPLSYYWAPDKFLGLVKINPLFLIIIMLVYPFASALGQEIGYRALFFARYKELFPDNRWLLIVVNAALFAFAHAFFERPIVVILTFMAGLVWAEAYGRNLNFPQVFLAHSIGGNLVFASGLGWEFCYQCGRVFTDMPTVGP